MGSVSTLPGGVTVTMTVQEGRTKTTVLPPALVTSLSVRTVHVYPAAGSVTLRQTVLTGMTSSTVQREPALQASSPVVTALV